MMTGFFLAVFFLSLLGAQSFSQVHCTSAEVGLPSLKNLKSIVFLILPDYSPRTQILNPMLNSFLRSWTHQTDECILIMKSWAGDVAQCQSTLLSMCEAISLIPMIINTTQIKSRKKILATLR